MKKTLKLRILEDDLNMIPILFSIFLLIRLISSYTPKISLLACLILEIAMKMTLKLVYERRPYDISMPKIRFLGALEVV